MFHKKVKLVPVGTHCPSPFIRTKLAELRKLPPSGAVAGQTLETLDQRVPGTIDAMFGIARGKTDPEAFRANLKRKIGAELFRQMFTKQPYTTWAGINTAVRNM